MLFVFLKDKMCLYFSQSCSLSMWHLKSCIFISTISTTYLHVPISLCTLDQWKTIFVIALVFSSMLITLCGSEWISCPGWAILMQTCKTEFQISTVNHFPCKRTTFMVIFNLSRIVFKHIQCIFHVFFF